MSRLCPRLIAITDTTRLGPEALEPRLLALCAAAVPGAVMVQLRDRQLATRERLALARRLLPRVRGAGQLFAVNDRIDLALLVEADALHLGEASVAPLEARRLVDGMWISRACHDPERAEARGADAVVLSPVVAPRKGRPALGIGALGAARRAGALDARAPLLYALGGIDASNARGCLEAGADGVASVGAALGEDPGPLLDALGIAR